MGPDLGNLHYELYVQLVWVHLKWQRYRALFADSKERVDLLNKAAPAFFQSVQDVMWDDVLLHIARITDPPASRGQKNLTIARILGLVTKASCRTDVQELTEIALKKAAFARDWRNKRLAHRRLPDTAGGTTHELAPASRLAVEEALGALRKLLNRLENEFRDSTVFYEDVIEPLGDVNSLLTVLSRGIRH
jgi:hypothetical protein